MLNEQWNGGDERKFLGRLEWDGCRPESRLRDQGQFSQGDKKMDLCRIFDLLWLRYVGKLLRSSHPVLICQGSKLNSD